MTLEERQAIEARLTELMQRGGGVLTPEAVVEDARDTASPLHARIFRETDGEAAHQRRIDLARQLIRSVRVNVTIENRAISVVGYVHNPDSQDPGYVPTASLASDHRRARETVLSEFARIEAAVRRAREIADVLGLDADLELMLNSIQRLANVVREAA